jgi:group I intron endonuclease
MYIYKLTNKINGKTYIGQTCRNPEVRWEQHLKSSLSNDPKQKKYLQNSIDKYGWANFTKEILEVIPVEKGQKYLDEREFFHILENNSFHKTGKGYNLTMGGSGTKGMGSCVAEKQKRKNKQSDTFDYANYDLQTGNLVNVYSSAREAAAGVGGLRYEHVNSAANWLIGKGKYAKTYKGFIWMKLPNGEEFPNKINLKTWESQTRQNVLKRQPKSKDVGKEKDFYEISQYNLLGDRVKTWPNNLSLIEREFKTFFPNESVQYNTIVNNLKGKSFTAGGYFWKRNLIGQSPEKIPVMQEYKGYNFQKEFLTSVPISMYDLNNNFLTKFNSIMDIPTNLASSFDKLKIYQAATDSDGKYKDNIWIFSN